MTLRIFAKVAGCDGEKRNWPDHGSLLFYADFCDGDASDMEMPILVWTHEGWRTHAGSQDD